MKKLIVILVGCLSIPATVFAQIASKQLISSTQADTWIATDGLGRNVATYAHGGAIRKDHYVGIFYFIWQGAHGYDHYSPSTLPDEGVMPKIAGDTISPYDNSRLLAADPTNPAYGPDKAFHYWGEPYFGYYLPNDEWVIRKHAQMLSDAGIDVLIFDVTNAAIYLPQVTKLAECYRALRREGKSTPSIAFITHSDPAKTVQRLYDNIYKKGLFRDLWFYWKGKPLLLCPPEGLTAETKDFFSTRDCWAWSKGSDWFGDGKDKWTWLDHTPQSYGWHESKDKPEEISVSIAEHPVTNIGRSFHDGKEPEIKKPGEGLYFAEQWKRALEVDPEFIFVSGWNEWVAMRFSDGSAKNFMGKPIQKGDTYFVDEYDPEYSRDAEPVKGAFNDNYYYQLVDNIRRFKGARALPAHTQTGKINIDGKFTDWQNTDAVYKDDEGDTFHRKHPGWGRIKEYVNNSGRNDITEARIISDNKNVYFYVKTNAPITSYTSLNWMHLYIKVTSVNPNWEGFNFIVNRKQASAKTASIEKSTGGWNWEQIGEANYSANGNQLELAIPKTMLGIKGKVFTIDFKWDDNSVTNGDPMQWLDQGDTAPNARFSYRYIKK
jgi:hypothetical protein